MAKKDSAAAVAEQPKTELFSKNRKCVAIGHVQLLKNASGDPRVKIPMTINLTSETVVGMPGFIQGMFESVAKDNGGLENGGNSIKLEGTSIRFYATEEAKSEYVYMDAEDGDGKKRRIRINSATMKTFRVSRKAVRGQDLSDVVLTFSVYAPGARDLWMWGYDMADAEIYAEFTPAQMSFGEAPTSEDGE